MATTTIVDTGQDTTYELDASNHTWVFAENTLFTGTPTSIHQASNLTNDIICVSIPPRR